jgi:predicted AAA+ superfamily ATPase
LLTGARQPGKSALTRRLFPDHHLVTPDLPGEAALAEGDPQAFLSRHPALLIIDEVQDAPGWFRHLTLEVDRQRMCCSSAEATSGSAMPNGAHCPDRRMRDASTRWRRCCRLAA